MVFGQPGLQNRTSKLPFILINTDNKRRERRKDNGKVATEKKKKKKKTILQGRSRDEKTDIINDILYLALLLSGKLSELVKPTLQ